MIKYSLSLALYLVAAYVSATPIVVDTSFWTQEAGPSNSRNTGTWVGLHSDAPEKRGNSSGALISDFELIGDFAFTGLFTPTTENYDDNDILGVVFGWQDESNHFRLGWSQNYSKPTDDRAIADITGRSGLFLIEEINGSSNTIFHLPELFWADDTTYQFGIERLGSEFAIAIGTENSAPNIQFSVSNDSFSTGKVGVYTESQTARFGQLQINGIVPQPQIQTLAIPEPSIALLLAIAFILMIITSSSKQNVPPLKRSIQYSY
ncbi:hypothetical protein [Thalassotalea montiporae]